MISVYLQTKHNYYPSLLAGLGRGVERQFFGASASCSNPLAEEETFFSSPARAGPIGDIESLGPVGGQVSVIAPLPERLPGLIEGSL